MRKLLGRFTALLARWADEAAGPAGPATFTGVPHR
jgi:hypothetical protein